MLPTLWNRPWRVGDPKADPFHTLHGEIDRMLTAFGRDMQGGESATGMLAPAIDVSETDDAIEVSAELPGIEEKDVSVELDDGVLTIKGEKRDKKEEEKKDYHLVERAYGSFRRAITLPRDIDTAKIAAEFSNG
ncbi:MAG: Hsp20 family protein, partial [Alphaproteobacteria bacterium]|nr:Hsp20 family protein [Alphaproteobacteria bacterium]